MSENTGTNAQVNEIYCYVLGRWEGGDVSVEAFSADGEVLAGHVSSNVAFAKHDIGITSERKHDKYREYYPDGYKLVWLDDPESDSRWQAALEINQEKYSEAAE